jgi:hypothetical protein
MYVSCAPRNFVGVRRSFRAVSISKFGFFLIEVSFPGVQVRVTHNASQRVCEDPCNLISKLNYRSKHGSKKPMCMSDPFGQPTPSKPQPDPKPLSSLSTPPKPPHHHSHRTSAVIGHETHVTYVSLVSRAPSPRPRAARPRGARLVSSAQRSHTRCPWAALRRRSLPAGGDLVAWAEANCATKPRAITHGTTVPF